MNLGKREASPWRHGRCLPGMQQGLWPGTLPVKPPGACLCLWQLTQRIRKTIIYTSGWHVGIESVFTLCVCTQGIGTWEGLFCFLGQEFFSFFCLLFVEI